MSSRGDSGGREARRAAGWILPLAVWTGLLTGFGEVVLLGIKRLYMGHVIRLGPDVTWMTPLADATLFLVLGLIMLAAARWRAALVTPRTAAFVLAFSAAMSGLLMYYPLHLYAKLVLAAGLAHQVARVVGRRPDACLGVVRRSLPWLASATALLAAGMILWPRIALSRHIAELPPARGGAPNVLLIVLDTVRAQNLSVYGYERATTPNLERWAARSVVFENAIATAPWTLPSHASMFTGRWPQEQSTDWEAALDDSHVTLAETLRAHGYLTGGFVANGQYCGYEFGLDRGFAHYEDHEPSPQEALISSSLGRTLATSATIRRVLDYHDTVGRKDAGAINADFLAWIEHAGRTPFFAFLNYFDAHETYLPPEPFARRFGPGTPRGNEHVMQELRRSLRSDWHTRPRAEIETEIDMYDGAIAYIDHQLDRLFEAMGARGLLENTIVIITSDHGEQFGEHGLFLHSNSLYTQLLHVPLIITYPAAVPSGQRVAARVSLRDLPATVMDLAGLGDRNVFPGKSLARYWSRDPGEESSTAHGDDPIVSGVRYSDWAESWHPTAKGDVHALMDDRYHYIRNGDGGEELYAVANDPHEERDLSATEHGQLVIARMRARLDAVLQSVEKNDARRDAESHPRGSK